MENQILPEVLGQVCLDARGVGAGSWGSDFAGGVVEALAQGLDPQEGPLLLAHPNQVLPAVYRRTNTNTPAGGSWLAPGWDRRFARQRGLRLLHRFLPLDKVTSVPGCRLITTLLPPAKGLPFYLSRRNAHHFVVPSQGDAEWLQREYGVKSAQITVIRPMPRAAVLHPSEPFQPAGERGLLVVRHHPKDGFERHVHVLRQRFGHKRLETLFLNNPQSMEPQAYLTSLKNAMACLYLVRAPMDAGTAALEALFHAIPTVFPDSHAALSERTGVGPYCLNRYLAENPTLTRLQQACIDARNRLEQSGAFQAGTAMEYQSLYAKLGVGFPSCVAKGRRVEKLGGSHHPGSLGAAPVVQGPDPGEGRSQ